MYFYQWKSKNNDPVSNYSTCVPRGHHSKNKHFGLQGQIVQRTISANPGLITMTTHVLLTVNPELVLIRL